MLRSSFGDRHIGRAASKRGCEQCCRVPVAGRHRRRRQRRHRPRRGELTAAVLCRARAVAGERGRHRVHRPLRRLAEGPRRRGLRHQRQAGADRRHRRLLARPRRRPRTRRPTVVADRSDRLRRLRRFRRLGTVDGPAGDDVDRRAQRRGRDRRRDRLVLVAVALRRRRSQNAGWSGDCSGASSSP